MSGQLLFVCAMNVCRSPLMAATFSHASEDVGQTVARVVISRGVSASPDMPMCEVASAHVTDKAWVWAHRSTPVSRADLEESALVIVASRAERAAIARLAPDARARTFTLREALALGAPAVGQVRVDATSADPDLSPLARYQQLLHGRRGLIAMPPAETAAARRLRYRRLRDWNPLDIPDVHQERHRVHAWGLSEAQRMVGTFHNQVAAAMGTLASSAELLAPTGWDEARTA